MPSDSSGNYTLPSSYTATTGETIEAAQHNEPLEDLAAGMTARVMRNGAAAMTGNLPMGTNKVTGMGDPTAAQDAATKAYVDSLVASRPRVRVATTANITIASALNSGDTLDGVTLANGDRVLVKDQSTGSQNGIYVVADSPARATDYDAFSEYPGLVVAVMEGSTNADTLWQCTADLGGTIDSTSITFVRAALKPSSNLSDLASASTALTNLTARGQGKETIGIPAAAMFPATTNGCASLTQAETTTNKINYKYLAFDKSSVEYAWLWFPTPKSYNASTFTMRFIWAHPSTTTNFGVVWQAEMLSLANDDALDTAVGTAVTTTSTGGTTGDIYHSSETSAITPSNTAAKQDWIPVRVSRLATDGSDTLDVDAHLIGVEIYYTTNAVTDA